MILAMEGGISLSEDPSFRFTYRPNGDPIRVEATDTEGAVFAEEWPTEVPSIKVPEDPFRPGLARRGGRRHLGTTVDGGLAPTLRMKCMP